MNRIESEPSSKQTAKRGFLARKLLQVTKRRNPATLPLQHEGAQEKSRPTAKVLGPYCNRDKWRLIVKEGGQRKSLVYESEQDALKVRDQILGVYSDRASRTIGQAIEELLAHKLKKGCREQSIQMVRYKLGFLPADCLLSSVTLLQAESWYAGYTTKVAVATHHIGLRYAKALFEFCIKQKYLTANPFADVQAEGKPVVGKLQLRQDEACKLSDFLLKAASEGDRVALALLVQVILGLRSGEVLRLRKRDLDCRATIIVVEGTKNKNAKRSLELHAPVIRELLLRRSESLAADAFIFVNDGQDRPIGKPALWTRLRRYCQQIGVPIVCPHSLRGLHSTLAVQAGATSSFVAQALGHGSDQVTRKHYIAPSALDSARSARMAGVLLGKTDLDSLITTLRTLPTEQLDLVCVAVGLRR